MILSLVSPWYIYSRQIAVFSPNPGNMYSDIHCLNSPFVWGWLNKTALLSANPFLSSVTALVVSEYHIYCDPSHIPFKRERVHCTLDWTHGHGQLSWHLQQPHHLLILSVEFENISFSPHSPACCHYRKSKFSKNNIHKKMVAFCIWRHAAKPKPQIWIISMQLLSIFFLFFDFSVAVFEHLNIKKNAIFSETLDRKILLIYKKRTYWKGLSF